MNNFFFIILSLIMNSSFSQNLVPNPSFEEYFSCPDAEDQLDRCKYWFNPLDGSPDYYNICGRGKQVSIPLNDMGFQYPRTGNAYVGIINFNDKYFSYREFLTTRLLESLDSGKTYAVKMYVSLSDSSQYFNSRFAFCLSREKKLPSEHKLKEYNIYTCENGIVVYNDSIKKDTLNWHLIEGEYTSRGGEKYLIIGLCKDNFSKKEYKHVKKHCKTHIGNAPYAYYYIDDILVEEKNKKN